MTLYDFFVVQHGNGILITVFTAVCIAVWAVKMLGR